MTALDFYSNDVAGGVAFCQWLGLGKNGKTKQNIKHSVIYSLPVTKELFPW